MSRCGESGDRSQERELLSCALTTEFPRNAAQHEGEPGEEPGGALEIHWDGPSRSERRAPTVADQLGGEVARRRSWSQFAPLRFPGDVSKCAPPRILVAKGRTVAPEADSAIVRALAVREQLDRYPERRRQPVVAKGWRLRDE